MAKMGKVEKYASKKAMAKHENAEGKKIVAMEKKMGEKDIVVKATKSSMKMKSAGKKINKSV
jgi:hypothetical protein